MERKKFPRALYQCTVSLWRGEGNVRIDCTTKNVSAGGVCLVMPEELQMNQQVRLSIALSDSLPPVDCNARVKWALGYRTSIEPRPQAIRYETGFQFSQLSEEAQSRIQKIVDQHG